MLAVALLQMRNNCFEKEVGPCHIINTMILGKMIARNFQIADAANLKYRLSPKE